MLQSLACLKLYNVICFWNGGGRRRYGGRFWTSDKLGLATEKTAGIILEIRHDPAADKDGLILVHGIILIIST
jgi:hypothetical protein